MICFLMFDQKEDNHNFLFLNIEIKKTENQKIFIRNENS